MKYLIVALILSSSTGCMYQQADASDIVAAISFCGSADKIVHIRLDALGFEFVRCIDGRSAQLHTK